MRRLRVQRDDGDAALRRKPAVVDAPSELIACVAAAAAYVGAPADYADLMADSGAAFALRISPAGFVHDDAVVSQWRAMAKALRAWGFEAARVVPDPQAPAEIARSEVAADRPVAVLGCFPEAPWRAGVVVHVGADGLWTVLSTDGRVHRMAPRAAVVVVLGEGAAPRRPAAAERARMWAAALESEGEDEGAQAWANWLGLLRSPAGPGELDVGAHEWLYELLLDARTQAVQVVQAVAEEDDGVLGDWLALAGQRFERLVEHLEARRPPVHSPEVYERFGDEVFRQRLARHIEDAAEMDLSARSALTAAVRAEYPPEDVV